MLPQLQSGITFAVDDVTPADKPIWSETLADSLSRRFKRKILILPDADLAVTNAEAYSRCHPFIDAIHTAFAQHRPSRRVANRLRISGGDLQA